jgi:hypothetical protein
MSSVEYLIGSEHITNRPLRPFDDVVCGFLARLSEKLMGDAMARRFPDIIALAFWMRKSNIQRLKEQYRAYSDHLGRGLVFHIAPANIPVNFAFSWLFGLLAGNANIVRVPSKPFPQIRIICEAIAAIAPDFPEIQESTAFVSYPAHDDITALFCAEADARVIWGGDATVEHIRALKAKPRCLDVVFPDRYSVCIIDGKAILEADEQKIKKLAECFYNDTYLMDQNACSSPQFILWQNVNDAAKDTFWNAVASLAKEKYGLQAAIAMDKYVQLCKDGIDYGHRVSIKRAGNILYRAEFSMQPMNDLTSLRGKGGYFYEFNLNSLEELVPFITEKYQTVTYFGISPETIKEMILKYRLRGIDRIVPIGSAMDIGLIWDGFDLINILSRVVAIN